MCLDYRIQVQKAMENLIICAKLLHCIYMYKVDDFNFLYFAVNEVDCVLVTMYLYLMDLRKKTKVFAKSSEHATAS